MTTISEDASMYQSHGFDADADSDADTEAEAATADPSSSSSVIRPIQAPVEAIEKLCQRNNYPMVQENGQRCYGPPPDWMGPAPKRGCEVFVGSIPRDCFEDELVPIFEIVGPIYMFQLMLDLNGFNRGWGFCVYTSREHAREAEDRIDRFEIRPDKKLGVRQKVDNCRLFVGGIPKDKVKEEIMQEMQKVTEGVRNVIIVQPMLADRCAKNRGFAFVEYESNNAASRARYNLYLGRIQLWVQTVAGDWAQPEHVPLSGNSEIRRWTKYI